MLRLVRAEFVKLRTTQVWFWLLLAAIAISALICVGGMAGGGVTDAHDVAEAMADTNGVCITTFVLGILVITTEFRYQTVTPTVLGTPRRSRIVAAKLVATALVGAGFGLTCVAVSSAVTFPWAAGKGISTPLDDHDVRRTLLGLPLVIILMGLVGVGVGALIRNQVTAVVLGLIFLLVLQNIVAAIPTVKSAWPYTPSGGVTAVLYSGPDAAPNHIDLLPVWGGAIVLLTWALIPAIAGATITMNRDIT